MRGEDAALHRMLGGTRQDDGGLSLGLELPLRPGQALPTHSQGFRLSAETVWPHAWIQSSEADSAQAVQSLPHPSLAPGPAVSCGAGPRISLSPRRCHYCVVERVWRHSVATWKLTSLVWEGKTRHLKIL